MYWEQYLDEFIGDYSDFMFDVFFFNDTATTEIYTLSLHDALPISSDSWRKRHERDRINLAVLQEWIDNYDYQLKFVIDKKDDIEEIQQLLIQLDRDISPYKVLLMPQGITVKEIDLKKLMVVELCKEYGFRYCDRLHISLFGNKKGT